MLLAGCRATPAPEQLNIALAVFPDEAARYDRFVADFESQHHVRVNVLAQTYTDILQAMRVQAASRGSLDLVELDLAMLGEAHDMPNRSTGSCHRRRAPCFRTRRGTRPPSIATFTLFRTGSCGRR